MVTKSRFVILFQAAFILIFTLGLLFPAGKVVYAQDGGTTETGTTEEVTPGDDSGGEESGGEASGGGEAETPAEPAEEAPAEPATDPAAPDGTATEGSAVPEPVVPADPVVEPTTDPALEAAPAVVETGCVEGAIDEATGEAVSCGAPIVAPPLEVEEPEEETLDTPAEVLEALPAETELVVTDALGEELPLASVEAEDALVEGDPMWCPGDDVPSSGNCIHTMTIEGAIMIASIPGNGNSTIYVADNYHRNTDNPIVIAGPTISNLVIVGGVTNMFTGEATSQTSLSQGFVITNVLGTVTLDNFILTTGFYGNSNPTVSINNSGVVNLNNMTITNVGKGDAVKANHSFMVAINDSKITDYEGGYGIRAENLAFLFIKDTSVTEHGKEGGILLKNVGNTYMDGVKVMSFGSGCSTKGSCSNDAISAVDSGNIYMKHVLATSDWGNGFKSDGGGGYITLIDSVFSGNLHGHGVLIVDSHHNVYLEEVKADYNGEEGVEIKTPGFVTIKDSQMNGNRGDYGLEVNGGAIAVSGTTANGNRENGAYLDSNSWIKILNSEFSYNQFGYGLEANANWGIDVSGSDFSHNGWMLHLIPGPEPDMLLGGGMPAVEDRYGAHLMAGMDIRVIDSVFNYNYNEGLLAVAGKLQPVPQSAELQTVSDESQMYLKHITADILLDGVDASHNGYPFSEAMWPGPGYAFGASLQADGKLTILNSDFDENRNYGLRGEAGKSIKITETSANENGNPFTGSGDFGALLKTDGQFEAAIVDFSGNWGPGLQVFSKGSINVDGIQASNNQEYWGTPGYGALFDTMFGGVTILNGAFDNNDGFGLFIFANRGVSLDTVTANDNGPSWFLGPHGGPAVVLGAEVVSNGVGGPMMPPYNLFWANGDGAFIKSLHGSITITDSQFNGNTAFGLVGDAHRNITLTNVEAIGNGIDGALLRAGRDITITCSTFSDNGVFGLDAVAFGWDSTITLDNNTFENNGWGDKFVWAKNVVENTNTPCGGTTPTGGLPGGPDGNPFVKNPFDNSLIPVTGGEFVALSCDGLSVIQLPDGEETIFNQPMCGYMASMELVDDADLPSPVPDPWDFVDGFTVTLMFNNEVVSELPAGATDTLVFPLTEEQLKQDFHMLFWDVTANGGLGGWIDLGGVREAMKWVKTHNQTGTFLLVK